MTPPVREFRQKGMHRLIPSRYSESGTVLEEVAGNEAMLADAARLDAATNERIHGEHNGLSGISPFELVYGIPNAHIIRAAFLHPGPFGSRFNDTTRGAWYAAKKVETSIAEVAYHKSKRLSEMVVPGLPHDRPNEEVSTYDDWQADFQAPFHILEPGKSTRIASSQNPCRNATCRRSCWRDSFSPNSRTESFIPACATRAAHAWPAFVLPWSISRARLRGMNSACRP